MNSKKKLCSLLQYHIVTKSKIYDISLTLTVKRKNTNVYNYCGKMWVLLYCRLEKKKNHYCNTYTIIVVFNSKSFVLKFRHRTRDWKRNAYFINRSHVMKRTNHYIIIMTYWSILFEWNIGGTKWFFFSLWPGSKIVISRYLHRSAGIVMFAYNIHKYIITYR